MAAIIGDQDALYESLREILRKHANQLTIGRDTASEYCLNASVGAATLAAWGGKLRQPTIPVAWLRRGTSNVSYHLIGLAGNEALVAGLSRELRARLSGKTCFTFPSINSHLLEELDGVTANAIAGMRRAGFIEV